MTPYDRWKLSDGESAADQREAELLNDIANRVIAAMGDKRRTVAIDDPYSVDAWRDPSGGLAVELTLRVSVPIARIDDAVPAVCEHLEMFVRDVRGR